MAIHDGGPGDDNLIGTPEADLIRGFAGNDLLQGRGGNDTIEGGTGNDVLGGDSGDDILDGGDGSSDTVSYRFAPEIKPASTIVNGVTVNLATGKASGGDGNAKLL